MALRECCRMGDDRVKLLFVDHVPEMGGGQVVLQRLVENLSRDRFCPAVACAPEGALWRFCERQGVPHFAHWLGEDLRALGRYRTRPNCRSAVAAATVAALQRLRRAIRLHRAGLVHCNSNKDHLIGGLAGRLARVPVVWHMHDMLLPTVMPTVTRQTLRAAAMVTCSRLLAVSEATAESLRRQGFPGSQLRTVLNGVAPDVVGPATPGRLRRELGVSAATPLVGIVGRLCPWKGQQVFLRAAAEIAKDRPVHFVLIGGDILADRGYRSELEALARRLGIAHRVSFTGARDDRLGLLCDLEVVVHASVEPEPFGLVVVEAMLAEKAVVASDAGGVREIVVSGETGLLVPPGDAAALARACLYLLGCPKRRQDMGRRGRARALQCFSARRMTEEVESLYAELLRSSGRGGRS
ncbi:MAG: hypothetical protein COZ57_07740 [Armatimonadetes bacterium CG_4_8_14_3_um_filter_66_20]|nr:MAG: hypothetical protein COZ57_07740 [Armatimonadetes bacterium CG_4_8_14_3_um_filter_66_20]